MPDATALTGTPLFGRTCRLTVGSPTAPGILQANFNDTNTTGLDLSGFSISFVVEKSLVASDVNTCAIKVLNLNKDSRQQLSGASSLTVLLEAGYIGGLSQIYFAGARAAWSTREGANYITHIESSDTIARPTGLKKTKKIPPGSTTGSIYRTRGARVPIAQAFAQIAQSLGIQEGNLQQALANGSFPITAVNGSALLGNGARRMTDLCRSCGLEWSVQDGKLQLLNIGQTLSTTQAILINSSTGLINSPSVDSQGALELTTLLIPGLAPGVLLDVESLFVKGGFRIEKIRYEGDTAGQSWYAHIAAAKY
jgi:hypothetical protein